jgi:hypothetical protein
MRWLRAARTAKAYVSNGIVGTMAIPRAYTHVERTALEAAASDDPAFALCIAQSVKIRLGLDHCAGRISTLPFVQAELPNIPGEVE